MSQGLTKITLHGPLGKAIGKKWTLSVKSVTEAIHAIDINSGQKLRPFLMKNNNKIYYKVLVNKEVVEHGYDEEWVKNPENVTEGSELSIERPDIREIDIVPVVEGNFWNWFNVFAGSYIMATANGNSFMFMVGLSMFMKGVSSLLAEPPKYQEFREIEQVQKQAGYLFSGPVNTITEGGPVPLVYGRMLVGSQVIHSTYDVGYKEVEGRETTNTT